MMEKFECLNVEVLFHQDYWDGPLSGVCEYQGDKLYFWCSEELMFKYPETDPAVIAVMDDEEPCQWHRCRVYSLFKLPDEVMSDIIYNNELFERYKTWWSDYRSQSKQLPEYFSNYEKFFAVAWQWCVGYTTEDVWDRSSYNKKRFS